MADLTITKYMKRGDTMFLDYRNELWIEVTAIEEDSYIFSTSLGNNKLGITGEDVFDLIAYFPTVYEIRFYKRNSMRYSCFYKSRSNSM